MTGTIIQFGVEFDTEFDEGCIATSRPDEHGNFTARDSDGAECQFNIHMVTWIDEPSEMHGMQFEMAGLLKGGQVQWVCYAPTNESATPA